MNAHLTEEMDLLATHDELELAEFGELDAEAGGAWTTWACGIAITVPVSMQFCPTTKCTSQC